MALKHFTFILVENTPLQVAAFLRLVGSGLDLPRDVAVESQVVFIAPPRDSEIADDLRAQHPRFASRIHFDSEHYRNPDTLFAKLTEIIGKSPSGGTVFVLWDDHLGTVWNEATDGLTAVVAQRFADLRSREHLGTRVRVVVISAARHPAAHTARVKKLRIGFESRDQLGSLLEGLVCGRSAFTRPTLDRTGPAGLVHDLFGGSEEPRLESLKDAYVDHLALLAEGVQAEDDLRALLHAKNPIFAAPVYLDRELGRFWILESSLRPRLKRAFGDRERKEWPSTTARPWCSDCWPIPKRR